MYYSGLGSSKVYCPGVGSSKVYNPGVGSPKGYYPAKVSTKVYYPKVGSTIHLKVGTNRLGNGLSVPSQEPSTLSLLFSAAARTSAPSLP